MIPEIRAASPAFLPEEEPRRVIEDSAREVMDETAFIVFSAQWKVFFPAPSALRIEESFERGK
jgi:hypothetical protein